MRKYSCLIVEDEKKARNFLRNLIELECPNLELLGEASTLQESLELIQKLSPEIIFLDIQLGLDSSFELFKTIDFQSYKIIFITAYEAFAMQAFRYSAVDYLHKPIDPDLLVEAVDKATKRIEQTDLKENLEVLMHNLHQSNPKDRKIVLNTLETAYILRIKEIIYCQSEGNYTRFVLEDRRLLTSKTLKDYEDQLKTDGFLRVHKSYLINLDHLVTFSKKDGGFLEMTNGVKIPLAVRKKEEFLKTFESWK